MTGAPTRFNRLVLYLGLTAAALAMAAVFAQRWFMASGLALLSLGNFVAGRRLR